MSLDHRSVPDRLYDEVRALIVSGALQPGQPVRQDILAGTLDASKIPLREALSRLEQDGLVELIPRRGYEVTKLTPAGAEDIFDLRLRIEPAATAHASLNATEEQRAAAAAVLKQLDEAIANGDPRASDLNREFHVELVRPGGRPLTTSLVDRLHALATRYVHAHLAPEGRSDQARRQHNEIFDAWMDGEAAKVEEAVKNHIHATLTDLRKEL